jgi:hypothetical protein
MGVRGAKRPQTPVSGPGSVHEKQVVCYRVWSVRDRGSAGKGVFVEAYYTWRPRSIRNPLPTPLVNRH